MGDVEFEEYTDSLQELYFQFLEGKKYDFLQSNQLCYLPQILSNYIQPRKAEELSKKIAHSNNLYYRIIIVNCNADGKVFSVPVVRVKLSENEDIIYDFECRRYKNWEDFLSNNRLPKCLMKFPENGIYEMVNGKLKFGRKNSPACSVLKEVHKVLVVTAKVVSIVTSLAADIEMLKPYNSAICAFSGISNGYAASHHAYQIYDLAKHGQGLGSDEARCHWIDIGQNVLMFSVTLGKIKFGIHQSEGTAYQNIISMSKALIGGDDPMTTLKKIQLSILCNHLSMFSDQAVNYFENNVIRSKIDAAELMFTIRRYVLKDNSLISKYRRFVNVDNLTISTVAQDITFSRKIPRLIRMDLFTITSSLNGKVDKIMKELKKWANGNASIMQATFRVAQICKDLEGYETLDEMCKHFNVRDPKDIRVNEKCIFEGSRGKYLELQKSYDVEKFPQFLSYAVEYLSEGNDNLDAFRKYFNDRVVKEMDLGPQVTLKEREWINALTLENLNYAHSVPPEGIAGVPNEGINLVKQKFDIGVKITHSDLFKLAKRLLGRVGDLDLKLHRSDVKWVVVASKKSGFAVIVAPKLDFENVGSISGCYPVFKRIL